MLTISFVSECRLWKAFLTTVWHSFWVNTCSKKSSAKQREKNVVLVASPLRMLSMIKLKQWFFKTILYQNINYLLNCNYQLCANLLSNFAFTNTFNSGWDLTIKCNHITFIKLYCWLWVIGCNWLSYNTNLKPRAYLYFEKLFKRNPRALRSFFFFEIGSEEGSQYGDTANSLDVKVYLSCSDIVDSQ